MTVEELKHIVKLFCILIALAFINGLLTGSLLVTSPAVGVVCLLLFVGFSLYWGRKTYNAIS